MNIPGYENFNPTARGVPFAVAEKYRSRLVFYFGSLDFCELLEQSIAASREDFLNLKVGEMPPNSEGLVEELVDGPGGFIVLARPVVITSEVSLTEALWVKDIHDGHTYFHQSISDFKANTPISFRATHLCHSERSPWNVIQEPGFEIPGLSSHVPHMATLNLYHMLFRAPELTERKKAPLTPSEQKAKRKRKRRDPEPVVVIDLRRSVSRGMKQARRHGFHHRWVVRTHWRNQAYGPGRKLRRRVLIPAHLKGPSDAPLLQREKVYRV